MSSIFFGDALPLPFFHPLLGCGGFFGAPPCHIGFQYLIFLHLLLGKMFVWVDVTLYSFYFGAGSHSILVPAYVICCVSHKWHGGV